MTERAVVSVFDEETVNFLRKVGFQEEELVRDEAGHEFVVLTRGASTARTQLHRS